MNRIYFFVLFTLGCATTGTQSEGPILPTMAELTQVIKKTNQPPIPIPTELRAEITQAERIGAMIFQQDQAHTAGNEALLANTTAIERSQLAGQVSQPEANDDGTAKGSWIVQFLTDEAAPKIQFRIRVFLDSQKPTFEKLNPPLEASPHLVRLMEAQKTALTAMEKNQNADIKNLRPILFPVEMNQQKLFIVYLLAGTPHLDKVTFGKHFRMMVSADGKTITRQTPMESDPLETPIDGDKKPLMVIHKDTAWPNETHVYASLAHQRPVVVGTIKFIWTVANGRISLSEKRPEKVVEPESKFNPTNTMNEMDSFNN